MTHQRNNLSAPLYIVPINKDPAGFYSAFFFLFGYTSQHRLLGQRRNRSAISRRYRDVHSGVIANRIGDLIVDPSDPAFLRHSPPLHTFFFPACRSLLAFVLHRLWPWGFVSVSFSFFFFFLHPRSILLLCYSTLTSNCVCVCCAGSFGFYVTDLFVCGRRREFWRLFLNQENHKIRRKYVRNGGGGERVAHRNETHPCRIPISN